MKDQEIKKYLAFAVSHRNELCRLLGRFYPKDLEKGELFLPEEVLNEDLKPLLIEKFSQLTDYSVSFSGGMLFLEFAVEVRQLGPIKAMLMLSVDQFLFEPGCHRFRFRYKEDVTSLGNPLQAMLLKAAGSGQGGYLQKLLSLKNIEGIRLSGDFLSVDLDQYPNLFFGFLGDLSLEFSDSRDGILKLNFRSEDVPIL